MPVAVRSAQTHSYPHAGGPAGSKPKLYNPRHPERTLLYQTIAEHFETWHELASVGQFDGQGDLHTPKSYVRQAFRKYLECGIFAHGRRYTTLGTDGFGRSDTRAVLRGFFGVDAESVVRAALGQLAA